MSRFTTSISADYFEAKYAADPDPWQFAASAYERDKYAATLAALPHPTYGRALEVGCSIGVFTRQLAPRCGSLVAIDAAETALTDARTRCRDVSNVTFEQAFVPASWPAGRFDLILLSEILYFFDRADVEHLAERIEGSLATGGDIVLVHWLGETHYPLTGDEATEAFMDASAGFAEVRHRSRTESYRLDVLGASSRAASEAC